LSPASLSSIFLQNLIVAQLMKKFPAFYEIRSFITVKMAVFWDIAIALIMEAGSNFETCVPDYTAQYPRRQSSSYSTP
jgi:hypothetical protein